LTAPAAKAPRIGDLLLREGLVTQDQLNAALAEQRHNGTRVGYNLVKLGFIKETDLTRMLARQHKMPAVDLTKFQVDPRIAKLIPAELALKHSVLPLKRDGRTLTVAMSDPASMSVLDDIKFITRLDIFPVIAGEFTLRNAIEKFYESGEAQMQSLLSEIPDDDIEILESEAEDGNNGAALIDEAPVVKLINAIMTDALKKGASDIHFECFEKELRVRYRIDGALQEIMKPPIKMRPALISRFKIMASLNIAERRVPQDGRIKLKIGSKVIDFRVSTLPTLFGEKVVLRILDKGNLTLDLGTFGIEPRAERELMEAISNPYGMVLVTGPTGSGKTTTLYSALSKINNIDVNIMTAEDPVEYNLFGINQVLVRTEIGMTFAAALKAFLRQDPNIIMLGEIRDLETGGIAIKAALTGHLVCPGNRHASHGHGHRALQRRFRVEPDSRPATRPSCLFQVRRGVQDGQGRSRRSENRRWNHNARHAFHRHGSSRRENPRHRCCQAIHGPDHARHQDGGPSGLPRQRMRAMRWNRPQGPARSLRSDEHDAQSPKADHAERGCRRNSEGSYRRGNAHPPHGWLAESSQGNLSPRAGSPRNRSMIHTIRNR
jgi:type II secretory ATPase GspE/PulE/Tfp pilus assembly ATPase PilB-like protein